MKKILFVCTGNTCRSPMAEYVMNYLLAENGLDGYFVASSAGVSTMDGLEASGGSVNAVKRIGIDLSTHKSTQVTGDILRETDLILTMGRSHKMLLEMYFGDVCKDRLFTLGEFASLCDNNVAAKDIMDPYMMDDEVYEKVCDEITAYLEIIIKYLKGILKQ